MCICSQPARLSKTRIYAGEFVHQGEVAHTLVYQNNAQNAATGPNCMILHLPSAAPMSQDNAVLADDAADFLSTVIKAVHNPPVPRSAGAQTLDFNLAVFEYGIYTVVLSDSPARIVEALEQVPENKRPDISPELMNFYAENFPGWTLALCCFDNRDQKEATPLVWWYRPMFKRTLFAPGIDAHDGHLPDLNAVVRCDHEVVFGTSRPARGANRVIGRLAQVEKHFGPMNAMVPRLATYRRFGGPAKVANADFILPADVLHASADAPEDTREQIQRGILRAG